MQLILGVLRKKGGYLGNEKILQEIQSADVLKMKRKVAIKKKIGEALELRYTRCGLGILLYIP
jgi:hypothetical protein